MNMNIPAFVRTRLLASFSAALLAVAATSVYAADELRPNIRALPASDLSIVTDFATGGPELRFGATTWNAGLGPLELRAGETGAGKQNVYQRIFRSDSTYYDRLAGEFTWHPDHNHFHFEDYATYVLQPLNAPGSSARTSQKTTFCVMDTDKVDARFAGAPRKAVYSACGASIQGMSVGWGDTYGAHLPGQSIDLSDWADGDFKLTIIGDPEGRILETSESDNVACLLLHISITDGTVVPITSSGCEGGGTGSTTVSAMTPSSGSIGSIVAVTISGTGFVPGVTVSLVNGSGAKPVVGNVVVQSSTTITAVLNVKKGNTSGDTSWDLSVGNAVLRDAFVVLP
jgi:hypothetical protein